MCEMGSHLHLADEPVLVDRPALFAARQLRRFSPHLLHILEHHVAVTVKGLYSCQKFPVVSDGNQDLGVAADGGLEDREGPGGEFVC